MMTNPQENSSTENQFPALTIMQGKTQFPTRPITKSRFLIGAGNICDLQLGDSQIPLLHTMLLVDQGKLTCESVVSEPPLFLNGKKVRDATLNDGDILQLGKYSFLIKLPINLHHSFHSTSQNLDLNSAPHVLTEIDDDLWNLPTDERQEALAEMSAADLVDLLEMEMDQLEELEEIKLAGLDAMIHEALEIHSREACLPLESHLLSNTPEQVHTPTKLHDADLQFLINLISDLSQKYAGREQAIPLSVREELIEAQEQLQLLIYMMDQQRRSA